MAIKTKQNKYKCSYCEREYVDPTKADLCRDGHDLVYVQMSRGDVNRLLQFIFTRDDSVLSSTAVRSLQKCLAKPGG